MASNYTENYGLCQWEATDQVLRTEFNKDNAKVDEALKGTADVAQAAQVLAQAAYSPENSPFAVGSYTGDGQIKRLIELGFTPKAVIVIPYDSVIFTETGTSHDNFYGGLAVTGYNASNSLRYGITEWDSENSFIGIAPTGFWVNAATYSYYSLCTNTADNLYYYIAFK